MIDFALLRSKLRRALSSLGCTFFILSLKPLIEFVTSLSEVSILLSICLNFAFVVAALYGLILFEGDFFALFKGRTLFFALIGFGDATTWRALPPFPTVPSIGVRAIFLTCVARLPPLAVLNLPPLAVAPVPLLANLPRLSREYLRAIPISCYSLSFPINPSGCGVFPLLVALACSRAKPSPPCRPRS
jgi:hypothetical protein